MSIEKIFEEKALDVQVGGTHYKEYVIQPMEYGQRNKLPPREFSVVKYVTRWRDKGGVQDLIKARHCIDLLIQIENLEVNK